MEYSQLKSAITSVIKENGNEEITGQLMQDALIAIINALGLGFQFMGKATPATDPGTPDARVFYIAFESGSYSNFGGVTLDGKSLALFLFSDNWSTITIDVPTSAVLTDYLKIADLAAATGQGTNTSMTQKAITDALDGKVDKVAGKGLSTNDFTNALKTLVENSIQQSKIVQELGDDATAIISQAAMTIILAGYAKIDGYYQSLTAGAAENLVGRGSVPASFLRRTTGGTADIGTGSAKITKLMGNSIVWNAFGQNMSKAAGDWTKTYNPETHELVCYNGTESATALWFGNVGSEDQHKYFISFKIKCTVGGNYTFLYGYAPTISTEIAVTENYQQATMFGIVGAYPNFRCTSQLPTGATMTFKDVFFVDLTLMFGAGNEPATVEAFKALFPLPYYAYNPGVVLPFASQKLVTTGFNQYNPETGIAKLLGNHKYQLTGTYTAATIDGVAITLDAENCFTPESNCELEITGGNATDTCVHLVWSGIRNGEYEPYEKHVLAVNPATLLDVDGNLVFPYGGMHGVGTAFDSMKPGADGFIRYAHRVFARVNLGDLIWSGGATFTAGLIGIKTISYGAIYNMICAKYPVVFSRGSADLSGMQDKAICTDYANPILYIKDSAYTDAASFKAAMDGVYLYYEVATPAVVELAEPIAASYYANDWGTEEWQPANGSEPYTAPCNVDVQYAMNAVDTLRRLPENYISTGSFENFCTELATKLGAALNKTITITPTYNDTTQEYNFTISIVDAG